MSKIRVYDRRSTGYANANKEYLKYIATRPGVDLTPMSDNYVYTKYIAERPHSSGLWGNFDVSDYLQVARDIYDIGQQHSTIYRTIVSLSEHDAKALGYDQKDKWVSLVNQAMPDIGKQFGIDVKDLKYAAAFHREETHPHCHIMFWSSAENQVKRNYISVRQQHECREAFARVAFEEERRQLVAEKTALRDLLIAETKSGVQELFNTKKLGIWPGRTDSTDLQRLGDMLLDLRSSLPPSGKRYYKYMPADVKVKIDRITDDILERRDCKKQYKEYLEKSKTISRLGYSSTEQRAQAVQNRAETDLKTRLGNIVLSSIKDLERFHLIDEQQKTVVSHAAFTASNSSTRSGTPGVPEHKSAFQNDSIRKAHENVTASRAPSVAYTLIAAILADLQTRNNDRDWDLNRLMHKAVKKRKKKHTLWHDPESSLR